MAFINEYISDKDIEKYNLKELIEKYATYFPSNINESQWTIDKEQDIWLLKITREFDLEIDHGRTDEYIFVFYYKGKNIEVRLWLEKDSSFNNNTRPYLVNWKLLSLSPNSFENLDIETIKQTLCDALKVYGRLGVLDQRHEGLVEALVVSCINFEECCK